MLVKQDDFKKEMFNHISDIRRSANLVQYLGISITQIIFASGLEILYLVILYPVEQIPDQGNAQRNKPFRLKREPHWIKTLGTQLPHGIDHEISRKRDILSSYCHSIITLGKLL